MDKKVLLMILDGWGIAQDKSVSAIDRAQTPFMNPCGIVIPTPHSMLPAWRSACPKDRWATPR